MLQDFSVVGVGITHTRPMNSGRKFIIRMPRDTGSPITVICSVTQCRPLDGGVFHIGASFDHVMGTTQATPRTESSGIRLEWLNAANLVAQAQAA